MQTKGMLLLTLRELWAKKIVVAVFAVCTLAWILLTFALNLDVVDGTLAGLRIFGLDTGATQTVTDAQTGEVIRQALGLETIVLGVERVVAGMAYWLGTLLGLFATASLLAGLLQEGQVDLLLSKPMTRVRILSGHILGIWLTMFAIASYLMGMVWLVMSIKSGIWNPLFFVALAVIVGMFAVLYGVVVLVTVASRSSALALITAYGLIFCSLILAAKDQLAPQINLPWRHAFVALYYVLPGFAEVTVTVAQLTQGESVTTWTPFLTSLLFGAVLYGAAAVWFTKRDF